MANCFHAIRKFAWLHYFWVWGILSVASVVAVFVLTYHHKGKSYSSRVTWIPFTLLLHGFAVVVLTGYKGRRYRHCYAWVETWWGKTLLQHIGISFGVLVNEMVTREGVTAYLMLVFCFHAACISLWLHFKVKFDLTVAWISTTAILVWSKPLDKDALVTAGVITGVLSFIITISNFMVAFKPSTDQIDENGRHSFCWFDLDSPWPSPGKGIAADAANAAIIAAARAAARANAAAGPDAAAAAAAAAALAVAAAQI